MICSQRWGIFTEHRYHCDPSWATCVILLQKLWLGRLIVTPEIHLVLMTIMLIEFRRGTRKRRAFTLSGRAGSVVLLMLGHGVWTWVLGSWVQQRMPFSFFMACERVLWKLSHGSRRGWARFQLDELGGLAYRFHHGLVVDVRAALELNSAILSSFLFTWGMQNYRLIHLYRRIIPPIL